MRTLKKEANDPEKELLKRKVKGVTINSCFFEKRTLEELNFRSYLLVEE
jgi:hypothetical protein